eukprot:54634-Pyramimonas_sp.AAC.2
MFSSALGTFPGAAMRLHQREPIEYRSTNRGVCHNIARKLWIGCVLRMPNWLFSSHQSVHVRNRPILPNLSTSHFSAAATHGIWRRVATAAVPHREERRTIKTRVSATGQGAADLSKQPPPSEGVPSRGPGDALTFGTP